MTENTPHRELMLPPDIQQIVSRGTLPEAISERKLIGEFVLLQQNAGTGMDRLASSLRISKATLYSWRHAVEGKRPMPIARPGKGKKTPPRPKTLSSSPLLMPQSPKSQPPVLPVYKPPAPVTQPDRYTLETPEGFKVGNLTAEDLIMLLDQLRDTNAR